MEQVLQVDLASTSTTAYEHFEEIKKAIESAAVGLKNKYDIDIYDIQAISKHVIAHATLPDDLPSDFQLGYHLRGISGYLMRHYKETYSPLVVAKKLLVYTVIPTATYNDESKLTTNDRFTAISQFSELLKNSDETSMNKINRILDILKED